MTINVFMNTRFASEFPVDTFPTFVADEFAVYIQTTKVTYDCVRCGLGKR